MSTSKEYDTHHRRPRARGGSNAPENLSRVLCRKHAAWHHLFADMSAFQIAEIINAVWLDPQFMFIVERRH